MKRVCSTLFSPSELLHIHNIDTIIIVINTLMCFAENCLTNFEKMENFKNKMSFFQSSKQIFPPFFFEE